MAEFQESDLFWAEYNKQEKDFPNPSVSSPKKNSQRKVESVPIRIPAENSWELDFVCRESDKDDGEMIPPHVLLDRRFAGKMTFSVCTGNGRTLKGRDLSRVRNSVLRMTGFLEG
ncbi:protein S40-1-like [Tasmannia lanceolata]|uniref:protein S40-1-like n=1 Tax=Tasmannia lanceolata TaxID=3420 RepID=UPI0040635404